MPRTDIHPSDTIDAIEQQLAARAMQRTRDAKIAAIHADVHTALRALVDEDDYAPIEWLHIRQRWLAHFAQFVPVALMVLSFVLTLTLAAVAGAV